MHFTPINTWALSVHLLRYLRILNITSYELFVYDVEIVIGKVAVTAARFILYYSELLWWLVLGGDADNGESVNELDNSRMEGVSIIASLRPPRNMWDVERLLMSIFSGSEPGAYI